MTLTWQTPRERALELELQRLRERARQAEARACVALALLRTVTAGTELEGVEAGVGAEKTLASGTHRRV